MFVFYSLLTIALAWIVSFIITAVFFRYCSPTLERIPLALCAIPGINIVLIIVYTFMSFWMFVENQTEKQQKRLCDWYYKS